MPSKRRVKDKPAQGSRLLPNGTFAALTEPQKRDLRRIERNAYQWAKGISRFTAHDRAVKLALRLEAMDPIQRRDLIGLCLKAERNGIMRAAVDRGWAEGMK